MSEELPVRWDDFLDECHEGRKRFAKCTVGILLDSLDEDARAKVEQALGNDGLTHSSIYMALRKRMGVLAPNAYTIGRHRRRECQCSSE